MKGVVKGIPQSSLHIMAVDRLENDFADGTEVFLGWGKGRPVPKNETPRLVNASCISIVRRVKSTWLNGRTRISMQ